MNDKSAGEIYGRIKEGVHVAGYTLERAWGHLEWLLIADRWRSAGAGFEDVNAFIDSIQLDGFRVLAGQRKRIVKRIKELQPKATNRAVARMLGVDHDTVNRDVGGNPPAAPGKPQDNQSGAGGNPPPTALTGPESAKLALRRGERRERDLAAEEKRLAVPPAASNLFAEARHGDFRKVLTDVNDVDAIITDPPYQREFLPMLRDLAAFANRALKPNGVLAVLYAQAHLPDAFTYMAGFRPYRWTCCYLTEGNGYVSHDRRVQSNFKPILIYGGTERFGDLIKSDGDAGGKERHHWGQNFIAFQDLIERLTQPGALVVDPFVGGGTTLFAARAAGRNFIGCDVDEAAVNSVLERLK
jgi:hypothetical protein